jgi:hypothetical protein
MRAANNLKFRNTARAVTAAVLLTTANFGFVPSIARADTPAQRTITAVPAEDNPCDLVPIETQGRCIVDEHEAALRKLEDANRQLEEADQGLKDWEFIPSWAMDFSLSVNP